MNWLVRYPVPFKDEAEESLAVNWPTVLAAKVSDMDVKGWFSEHGKGILRPGVDNKASNTVAFVRHVGMLT